jgi:UBX domain-containing protein 1
MSNIRGLGDMKGKDKEKGGEDDPEQGKDKTPQQQWYVGGAGQGGSGTNVVAPKKDAPKASEVVGHVFDSAKTHGAISKSDEKEPDKQKFAGAGTTLTGNKVDAEAQADQIPRCVLTFYSDAFTVDDSAPRPYNDPANAAFLDEVNQGRVPREIRARLGDDVDVELIDKKGEAWKDTPKPFKAFADQGHSLSASSSSSSSSRAPVKGRLATVDANVPTTSLRVTLQDGSKLMVKLNHSHTIADLRAHIEASKPTGKAFELRTIAPATLLENDTLTLKEANLLNAALVQRLLSSS